MPNPEPRPRIIDYEGSTYRTDFWEGKGRDYEDRAERIALRRLLPAGGRRLLEIGAGFGRLTEEYAGYSQVVLHDYSFSQLQYAREQKGDGRYLYVASDAYRLPFKPGVFDGATMIRVLHHMANVDAVLAQIHRTMVHEGMFILEFANKRNVKSALRFALKKQTWNPHDPEPVEFVELNFDFHPDYIAEALSRAGFRTDRMLPVSFFRLGLLKRLIPASILAGLDGLTQLSGWLYAPSVFTRNRVIHPDAPDNLHLNGDDLFICPECGGALRRDGIALVCQNDGLRWAIRDGIYDFKSPVDADG
ncbi:methyltransferase domain-containing protein [Anaerolineae bacterium CFX9]|nr:methyltransferase domain-containing protein [Anaerolineae bacterium CFX9]